MTLKINIQFLTPCGLCRRVLHEYIGGSETQDPRRVFHGGHCRGIDDREWLVLLKTGNIFKNLKIFDNKSKY
jgi:hypothetical protein